MPGARTTTFAVGNFRALQEEFAIDVTVGGFVGESVFCYGARTIRLLAYDCHHRVGIPECRVHTAYHWAPLSDLTGYDLLPADVPLAQLVLQRHLAEA